MKRRAFLSFLGSAVAAWPLATRAQQPKASRIAVLMNLGPDDPEGQAGLATFVQRLQQLGWTTGRNVQIDYRRAAGDPERLRSYAAELVALKPQVLVAVSTPALAAVRAETAAMPIVFNSVTDPVGQGFVASLTRPGGNITGLAQWDSTLGGIWLQLLKEMASNVKHVAVMFNPLTATQSGWFLPSMEAAAPTLAVTLTIKHVHDRPETEAAFAAVAAESNGGLVMLPDAFTASIRKQIISLAARYRLPAVYPDRFFTADGGLVSYGIDPIDVYRRTATYVDRILKGAKPGNLPVELPSRLELIIDHQTARMLGLTVLPSLLAIADEVIE